MDEPLNEEMMLHMAAEINHSETAFILREGDFFSLRWFTPKIEVSLCGHATLSAAHIMFENRLVDEGTAIQFSTKSGVLTAKKTGQMIELDFPQVPLISCESNEILEKAFGISPLFTAKNEKRYLIEIDNLEKLKAIQPDFNLLKQSDRGAFIITCKGDNKYDFYSRFFAPYAGINEDPVTGSAHCSLAPHWGKKLQKKLLKAFQASERGGEMECELQVGNRVLLRGNAITISEIIWNEKL